jgi:lysophospholipase L1-like esterase
MMIRFFAKRKITLLLLALLIGSLALNFKLYRQTRYYYLSINNVQLNPVELKRYQRESLPKNPLNTAKKTVVFFGDSRAAGWRSPKMDRFQFINRGIGGQTSAQAFLRFDEHVSYLKPRVIVVQVGGNDLRMLPLPPKERKDIVEDCKKNIGQIVKKSTDLGSTVILTTIFPLGRAKLQLRERLFWPDPTDISKDVEEVNAYIRSLAGKNVIIFDVYSLLEDKGKTKGDYAADLLHINSAGYEVLNKKLVEILKGLK